MTLSEQIATATTAIRKQWSGQPKIGIILGTGLGALTQDIQQDVVIPYADLPHFPHSTVLGHKGQLVCGKIAGHSVVVMDGRFHFYEGYRLQQITFPVRVMKALGCEILLVSNACGGLNPQFSKGDIMLIEDHINLMGDNPLIGPNDDKLGDRFPDMSEPYDRNLLALAKEVSREVKIPVQQGVYVAVAGPNLETRAEYRFLRTIGADVVGMSTVPEVIVAVHSKMRCLGFSIVTDMCLPDALHAVSHEEIIAVANEAEKKLRTLVHSIIEKL
ncbi:purine-nucleoside phosphorylase [Telmatocola sphagniphila]|uniref:Purine nucleoside phosphorylase n=1 Tax=Telmatocola sphagniphila TaxID=1123043 RepID=A0A8E6EU24_9BACT|nr:purine-nucleoside phosphorylase [Telmatocola sphagniphila]QVL33169.1 purine-nucleoside phosphorylase [Telmatocola sphagniphila]